MLDKTKRYLIVGLGLLGGKYALELSKAGFYCNQCTGWKYCSGMHGITGEPSRCI